MFNPPPSHLPYTDKYFTRSLQVLRGEGLNPIVTMQVFSVTDRACWPASMRSST